MIKKILIGSVLFSLVFIAGASLARAQDDGAGKDKSQVAACMQEVTAQKKADFETAQNAFLAAKKDYQGSWWGWLWSKERKEARAERKAAKEVAKENFQKDKDSCQKTGKTRAEQKTLRVNLTEQNGSGVSGSALLEERGQNIFVSVELDGEVSTNEPAHIHVGACPNPGEIKYPLTSIKDGKSLTILTNKTLEDLKGELPLAINVHKSASEASVYIACGDVRF